ncbi:MAG: transcriptional regulator, AraC family [Ramlibacter sp.]|nr:transcriptional regulator, AraC family [Ramlibacter sp.]
MSELSPSHDAEHHLRATRTGCSLDAGWHSLLLRAYDDPRRVDEFRTPAVADHLLVLVTAGTCEIEARYAGRWRKTRYTPGHIGMTAPGQEVTLRWDGPTAHSTLQLHLPAATLQSVAQELSCRDPTRLNLPSLLTSMDPVIENVMLSLQRAMKSGVPDIYGETAAQFLAAHLLLRHGGLGELAAAGPDDRRLRRVDAYIRENLGTSISLEDIAREAGMSRFHLLRLFKDAYGETPYKRLTRLRIEQAQALLAGSRKAVTEIAFLCGYENPAHFASAFRRHVGVSPSVYRQSG